MLWTRRRFAKSRRGELYGMEGQVPDATEATCYCAV